MPQILHRWRQLQRVSKYYAIRSSMGAVRIASRHSHSYKIAYTIPLCTLSSFTIVRAYEAWEILRWLYRWKKRRKNRRPKKNLGQRRIFLPMQNLCKTLAKTQPTDGVLGFMGRRFMTAQEFQWTTYVGFRSQARTYIQ